MPEIGTWNILNRFGRFAVVGAVGVVVNSSVLAALHGVLGLPLAVAGPVAFEAAVIGNFVGNSRWTFAAPELSIPRFAKFQAVALGGLIIATTTLLLLVGVLRVHYLVANLLGVGLATVWNFTVNFIWTWGQAP